MGENGSLISVDFFRHLIKSETQSLKAHCFLWKEISTSPQENIPENFEGDILVAIGQAELLMKERFSQFSGLIDDCEFKRGEKETTYQDLQGFWDIVYFQVEDVNFKFKKLSEIKNNNWATPKPNVPAVFKKKVVKTDRPNQKNILLNSKIVGKTGTSGMRAHIAAARQKLKGRVEPKQEKISYGLITDPKMSSDQLVNLDKENQNPNRGLHKRLNTGLHSGVKSPEKSIFDGGFFKVVTPVKKKLIKESSLERCSSPGYSEKVLSSTMLRELLRSTPIVHKDYSPCMRITRSMKLKYKNKLVFE